MADDTVTLALDGEVSLSRFAEAVGHFHGLLTALSDEAGLGGEVRWVIDALEVSSTIITSRATSARDDAPIRSHDVPERYIRVGQALESRTLVPFAPQVQQEAQALLRMVDAERSSVRFETPTADAIVRAHEGAVEPLATMLQETARTGAYGGVEGRVQTLSNRGRLRFTLYDGLNDRAVSCYLREGQEDLVRDVWGRYVVVQGWVTRDPETGRPLNIRQIDGVTPVAEGEPFGYRGARAAAPTVAAELPEETIRRLRDAD